MIVGPQLWSFMTKTDHTPLVTAALPCHPERSEGSGSLGNRDPSLRSG